MNTVLNIKDPSGMYSKTGRSTFEAFKALREKNHLGDAQHRKKRALKMLDDLEVLVSSRLRGKQIRQAHRRDPQGQAELLARRAPCTPRRACAPAQRLQQPLARPSTSP